MPSGTRLEVSNDYVAKVENVIRGVVKPADLDMIVSNIGVYPDLSAIYTTNASMDTAFVQVSLKENHSTRKLCIYASVRENSHDRCLSSLPTFKPEASWMALSTKACLRRSTCR